MMTLQEVLAYVEANLESFEREHGNGATAESWDDWFAERSRFFRNAISERFRTNQVTGALRGQVGDLSLVMADLSVSHVADGYRGVLLRWLAAAREKLEREAVPA